MHVRPMDIPPLDHIVVGEFDAGPVGRFGGLAFSRQFAKENGLMRYEGILEVTSYQSQESPGSNPGASVI